MSDRCTYTGLPFATCPCGCCRTRTMDLLIGELDAMEEADRE